MTGELISSTNFDLFDKDGTAGTGCICVYADSSPGFRNVQITLMTAEGEINSNVVRCSLRDSEAAQEMLCAFFHKSF